MIGPQALEHFQRRSSLIGSQNRSLCAIPWVALGSEVGAPHGALPSEAGQNPNRGKDPVGKFAQKGYLELGGEDKIGFAEPLGHCYELVDKQLNSLKDAMFSVTSQMAASITGSSSTALGRSGLSKQKDTEATAKVLKNSLEVTSVRRLLYVLNLGSARGKRYLAGARSRVSYEPEEREQITRRSHLPGPGTDPVRDVS